MSVLLSVKNLRQQFDLDRSLLSQIHFEHGRVVRRKRIVHAVNGISFDLEEGSVYSLVGESGCGKSTAARSIIRLIEPAGGTVIYRGQDITHIPLKDMLPLRKKMQMIFQDPYASLNPRQNVLEILEQQGTYTLSYRLMKDGSPIYVNMKAVRVGDEHLVIGINDVDAYMRHKEELERAQAESTTYARITALAGNYIAIFTVDPATDEFFRYTSTDAFDSYGIEKRGTDFFNETLRLAVDTVYAEDLEGFRLVFNKENILRDIGQTGLFELNYRMVAEGKPLHVSLRAAMVEEKDGPRLIVGLSNIEDRIQRSQEYENSLREARAMITTDGLTGVKNKGAYLNAEAELDDEIKLGGQPEFAIVVADLNGLKEINDQHGHQTGDNFLRAGCRAICDIFDHSPVFRVGGDEFAVIVRGRDYEELDGLMEKMAAHNERCIQARKASGDGFSAAKQMTVAAGSFDRDSNVERDYSEASAGEIYQFEPEDVVIACGMSRFADDPDVASVFDRADLAMFENKKDLKSR